MPEVQIVVKTKAELAALQQTQNQLKKLADQTADVTKRIQEMDKAEQATLKTQRVFGDQSAQMASHLSKLTKEAKTSGAEVEALATRKSRLLDGVKKLGNAYPVLGAALNALKNPFTLVAAAGILAKKALDSYIESVEKLAERVRSTEVDRSKFLAFFHEVAEAKISETALEKRLEAIAKKGRTAADRLAEVKALQDQIFAAEEKAAADAGQPPDPNLPIRKGVAATIGPRNAARQERETVDRLRAQLPGARARALQDKGAASVVGARAGDIADDLNKEEADLRIERQKLADQMGADQGVLGTVLGAVGFLPGQGVGVHDQAWETRAEFRERMGSRIAEIDARLGGIGKSRSLGQADVIRSTGRANASAGIVTGLERDIEEASGNAVAFDRQAESTARISDAATAPQRKANLDDAQFIQRRADAIFEGWFRAAERQAEASRKRMEDAASRERLNANRP